MSDNNRVRSRDPQIRAYDDRFRSAPNRGLNHVQFRQELDALDAQYRALSPDQQRTMRYNAAENLRRTATSRGDARTLHYLDQGYFPGGGMGMPPRNVDTGNFANAEQARALAAGAPPRTER